MSDQKPLILVDGSSYLYRAFHALPALVNSKGFPTGAIYGMINMLKRLMADYQPQYMAVIFDAKGKTFRDELFTAYKANRQAMPHDLTRQIDPIHDIIRALGIPLIMIDGVEADDVIGTLTVLARDEKLPSLISTGDKDLAQLVNNEITLINTMSNTLLNPETVKTKFGVPPNRIVDYLSLVGDSSDNIPGVPLVGPKTAVKWLHEYGSLENIMAHANQITGKVGENLRASIDQLPLIKSLVTIKMDVHLSLSLSDLALKAQDKKILMDRFKEMEFKSWLHELLEESKEGEKEHHANYIIINNAADFKNWINQLNQASLFSFAVVTKDLNDRNAKLVGISFALQPGIAAYIPFAHDYLGAAQQLSETVVLNELKPLLEKESIKKICHHAKYERELLTNYHIELKGLSFDTLLESYVLDSVSVNHDLASLALKYLGWRTIPLADIAGKGSKALPLNQIDIQKAGPYAAERADVTLQLHNILWPRVSAALGLKYIFENIEMPLVPVLARMELMGVRIDPKQLLMQEKELKKRLVDIEKEIFKLSGKTFNLNSPKQLQSVLFDVLKLPVLQKTPTGQASTADTVLQELALDFSFARLIIEYRALSKLISTYTSRLVEQINPKTHRVHTTYNQASTVTGRLSSSDPNLQNIPVRTAEGRRIRQAFIAKEGYKIISADYSQIELRLMAHISEDPSLVNAFTHHLDIHEATAAEVWGVPLEKVTQTMRRDAKAINFGLMYGMSAFGLTRQLGIDRKAAEAYIERYFLRYPNVKAYMESKRKEAKKNAYVETLWGRRLYLPDINAGSIPRQKAAERAAINAPLQGSAADIIKLAMINIDKWLQDEKINAHMIMQVHDELVFEAEEADVPLVIEAIRKYMSEVVLLRVPLIVAIHSGNNWDEASAH